LTPSLIVRLRAGDAHAGALLNNVYRTAMQRFCLTYLRNPADAEDAVQEIFCKVLSAREIPDNFRAWLYRIARNQCLDMVRSPARRRAVPALFGSDLPAGSTGDLTRLVRREQRDRLMVLVAALPPELREVLCLRYGEGLARGEISHVLDIPESVVKSRLFEGLKRLREHTSLLGG
jgi:RNA polymerase sigma-70 factor (ECF subfamily)